MTPDLDAVRAMLEGVTTLSSRIRTRPGYLHPIEIAVSEVASEVVFLGQGDFPTIGAIAATVRVDMDKAADALDALIAEVEANRATIAGLTAMIDACTPYLKEGETPAERIVREVKDCIMLMGMLAQDRKERDAGRATIAGLRAALNAADDALTEAEAILGGEYGDHYGPLCEIMLKLRAEIALLKGEKDGK